jgi:Organic solvent tolerance protein OstA
MKERCKLKSKYLLTTALTALLFLTLTWNVSAHDIKINYFYSPLTSLQDTTTLPLPTKDSISVPKVVSDTVPIKNIPDSLTQQVDTFSIKMSKDSLDGPVTYVAEDSAVVFIQEKKILLYGKTKTEYKDIILTAPFVELDQQTNILTAVNLKDSTGEIVERARFQQAENDFTSDTIHFNFKTQKGLTKQTFTQTGEMFVQGKDIKKVSQNTFFVSEGIFTTCNLDDPHFAFKTNRLKIINDKLAVSGPTHPEFEGVPVPIYLPFGFFPLSRGRHSGMLAPQFTTNEQYGLGLEGLGYYKVLNDFVDVTLRTNIYSYGGWTATLTPSYRRRYRFNGAFNLTVQNTKVNFKGDPDFVKNKSFRVNWNHNVDSKARPGTTFSASVNAGSTSFNRFVPNDPNQNFQNQLQSSIRYSKSWIGKPYNLTLSANHNQNNRTRLVNLSLPDAGFSVNTIYPFQPKESVGAPKWYEKLGIGYNGSFQNQVSFYDTAVTLRSLIDTFQWQAQHNIPITLSLPPILGGSLVVAPGLNYSQQWLQKTVNYQWNDLAKRIDTTLDEGFFIDQRASLSLSLNTAMYGTFRFKKSALRHVMRPSLSFSYTPDLNTKFIKQVQVDSLGAKRYYNSNGGSVFLYSPNRKFGGISFSLDNNLEMKYRPKKDTTEEMKKIRLIDGFGLRFDYNLIADSFQLSPISFYLRSTLFEKINISAGATVDPYQVNNKGVAIDRYAWQGDKFSLGRITTGNIAISTDFKSKPKDPEKEAKRKKQQDLLMSDPALAGDQQRLLDYMRSNPAEFVDFNIPWNVGLSFSLSFYEQMKRDFSGFETHFSSDINFNGGFNLTDKWNLSTNGYFNIDTKKLQTFQMSISRDMHCWQMAISVAPVGLYRFFSINISPKSALLQDLKVNRTRSFSSY